MTEKLFTLGPKMITHTLLICGLLYPNYTGHLLHMARWQELFFAIRAPMKVFSVNAQMAICLGINFNYTHLLHKRTVSESFV